MGVGCAYDHLLRGADRSRIAVGARTARNGDRLAVLVLIASMWQAWRRDERGDEDG
jgi:hypothetical protein